MQNAPKVLQRESWMTELPEHRKSFCGLESRQFARRNPTPRGDTSVWTDTPADKERKAKVLRGGCKLGLRCVY